MMRYILALVFMTSFALAADWSSYVNVRYGIAVDVPPDFKQFGDEPDNSDGLTFASADGDAQFKVWGRNLLDDSFREDMDSDIQSSKSDGWHITYVSYDKQKRLTWAAFSGEKGGRIFYRRALASCKNTQAVMFEIEYPATQKKLYDPIIVRIGKSLKAQVTSECP
jgi:hypothetical protein